MHIVSSGDNWHEMSNPAFWEHMTNLLSTELAQRKVFVCIEVLQPSQRTGVMSSTVSSPDHTFSLEGLVLLAVTSTCAHSFTRSRQLPFLKQHKEENDRRKYITINCHERMLLNPVEIFSQMRIH